MQRLHKKVIFYIPYEDKYDNKINSWTIKKIENHLISELISLGGGATTTEGVGYWQDEFGVIKCAKTKLIISYIRDVQDLESKIEEIASYIKQKTNSFSVCYELNDFAYLT